MLAFETRYTNENCVQTFNRKHTRPSMTSPTSSKRSSAAISSSKCLANATCYSRFQNTIQNR